MSRDLGYPLSQIAMLSDVLAGKPGKLSVEKENDLRYRLGLPPVISVQARPCPSCLAGGRAVIHADALDCQGEPVGAVVIVRPWEGVHIRSTPARKPGKPVWTKDQRERKERLGLTWRQIIEAGLTALEDSAR